MARYRDVYKTEKYMDDAVNTVLTNLLKRRRQPGIWDPIERPIETVNYDSDSSERNKILARILSRYDNSSISQNAKRSNEENEFASGTAVKRNAYASRGPPKSLFPNELIKQNSQEQTKMENTTTEEYALDIQHSRASESSHSKEQINHGIGHEIKTGSLNNTSIANSNVDVQNSKSEISARTPSFCPPEEEGNPLNDQSSVRDTNIGVAGMETETIDVVPIQTDQKSEFAAWCRQRHEQFNVSGSKNQFSRHETKSITTNPKKLREINPASGMKNGKTNQAKRYPNSRSQLDVSDVVSQKSSHAIKHSKSKSEVDISDIENKISNHVKKISKSKGVDISVVGNEKLNLANKYVKSRSEDNFVKTQACIKLTNENLDQNISDIIVDVGDFSRIKRKFPKLKDILPGIDSTAITTVPCSIEAVNIILRYLFLGRSSLTDLPNASIAVEALAASKNWEIEKFYSIFYDIFVQKILPSSNLKFIFSQASHYNLHDVCKGCQEIDEKSTSLSKVYKRKKKTCSISVTTYIEPLELSFPFNKIKFKNLEISFEKHIVNTIRFQALSGSFTVLGIYLNFNNEHIESFNNKSMLNIDYTSKNMSRELDLGTGRVEKPLRPIVAIHFKNPLEVNEEELVEIAVETDLEPFLCSTYPEEIRIRKKKKGGEFRVNVTSNFKIPKSNENVFLVGKLLYNVKRQPKL